MDDDASEEYLLGRAREGYLPAFEVLVRRHTGRAYGVAARLVGDASLAEDATQEAFLKAWTRLATFRGDAGFGTWLTRIVINEALALQRRRSRDRSQVSLEQALGGDGAPSAVAGNNDGLTVATPVRTAHSPVEQEVEDRQRSRALYAALEQLPEDQRVAVALTTLVGATYDDAAQILGVPVTTLQGRLLRGRQQLGTLMREWA